MKYAQRRDRACKAILAYLWIPHRREIWYLQLPRKMRKRNNNYTVHSEMVINGVKYYSAYKTLGPTRPSSRPRHAAIKSRGTCTSQTSQLARPVKQLLQWARRQVSETIM